MHRGVDDVAVGIEHLDVVLAPAPDEPLAEVVARRQDAALAAPPSRSAAGGCAGRAGRRRSPGRRRPAPRAAARADPPGRSRRRPRSRSSRPRRRRRCCRKRAPRAPPPLRARFLLDRPQRRVAQAVDQAVAQARLREIGVRLGIADAPAGHRHPAASRSACRRTWMRPEAGSTSRANASARYSPPAPTGPTAATASPGASRSVVGSSSVAPDSSRIDDVARRDLARRCAAAASASSFCSAGIEHVADGELLDDLRVLHLHVEALLVPVDQVLERRGQVLVGGDDGDELADVEAAGDREVAADQIEDERRHLRQQVVDELDQELPLVDVEADEEDLRRAGRRSRRAPSSRCR